MPVYSVMWAWDSFFAIFLNCYADSPSTMRNLGFFPGFRIAA